MDYIKIAEKIVNKLKDSGAKKIEALDVSNKTDLCKVLIFASVLGEDSAKILAQDLEIFLEKESLCLNHIDGQYNGKWIVLDFENIIIHLFQDAIRTKYNIENLWKDRKNSLINKFIKSDNKPRID